MPLFGTRCRTQGFSHDKARDGVVQHVHVAAIRTAPDTDIWAVQRRTHNHDPRTGESWVRVDTVRQNASFTDALNTLAEYEAEYRADPAYAPLFPAAEGMGYDHYRAFAEREGYVFDRTGKAHARPAPAELPADAEFDDTAIASADTHLKRTAADFGSAATPRRLPDVLFLFDAFNHKAIGKKHNNEMAALRVLHLMDTFVQHIESYAAHLGAYCADHLRAGAHNHLALAGNSLIQARLQLRQMGGYGVDVTAFEKMTMECDIIVAVVHAQGTYDMLRRQHGNFEELETVFKNRAAEAMRLYRQLDKTETGLNKDSLLQYAEGYTALQEMMIQGGAPAAPAGIRHFIARYKDQRTRMIAPQPPHPKPPAP